MPAFSARFTIFLCAGSTPRCCSAFTANRAAGDAKPGGKAYLICFLVGYTDVFSSLFAFYFTAAP
jgi:hypothetical protein